MTVGRPNRDDEQSVHLHAMPRSLIARAKSRAALLGLTFKEWITGVIERALSHPHDADVTPRTDPLAPHATLAPRADDAASPIAPPDADPPGGRDE